jgi:glycosyltransferase involved in cell wall biosynthesis
LTHARPLRVVFCWSEVSGYAAACFQALARRSGVDLHVLHPDRILDRPNPFDVAPLLQGVSHEMFDAAAPNLDRLLLRAVVARNPDVVVHCGWIFWPYTRLAGASSLRRTRMIMGMDSPWRGTLLQRFARLRLSRFISRLDLVVTAGERSAEYARRIGVANGRLRTGFYGFDYHRFAAAAQQRPTAWPRQFLFAGRYVPAKDLSTLVRAYQIYRAGVETPWGLTCRGAGPDAGLLRGVPGVIDAGFVQPAELPEVFASHGAFVLPSRFEPWGVVIAEAAAAGLPVICSAACGAAADVVRPYYNGIVVPPQDPEALARAMRWLHDHETQLAVIGGRGPAFAAAFSAAAWAERWHQYILEVVDESVTGLRA